MVQPVLRDALQLAEEVELGLLARIAVFAIQQMLGEMENDGVVACVFEVLDGVPALHG